MNVILSRSDNRIDGVFGVLTGIANKVLATTLEHAYFLGNNKFAAKIPAGTYTCKRGKHRLHGMTSDFETFQVCDVPGHTNVLFHWGNYNRDSDGCILLGKHFAACDPKDHSGATAMITSSRVTWSKFMDLQKNVNEFTLTVKDTHESPQ